MEASKLYDCTFLQFEKQLLWGKIHYYDMRIFLNPYDSDAKRKRVEALNKIVEVNKKIDTMHEQVKSIGRRNNYETSETIHKK